MTYSEKLKDPRWQKYRLKLLEAANWTCVECGRTTESLHVHHGYYKRNTDPWDYPDDKMRVLCETCHSENQDVIEDVHRIIAHWPIKDLEQLLRVIEPLEFQGERPDVLFTLAEIVNYSAIVAMWAQLPERNEPDFEWILRTVLDAVAAERYQAGWENGLKHLGLTAP